MKQLARSFSLTLGLCILTASIGQGSLAQTAPPGSIAGTIVDSTSHTPVSAARVKLVGTAKSVLTGASGAFTLPAAPGTWKFTVTKTGYITYTSAYMAVQSALATNAGNVPIVAIGGLTGTVTRSDTGAVLSGVTVIASPGGAKATSSSKGIFLLNEPAGTYSLTLRKTAYLSQTIGPFSVVGVNQTNIGKAALVPTAIGTVTGTVRAGDTQKLLAGVAVSLHSDPYIKGTTNTLGVYTLTNVPVGSQSLDLSKTYYVTSSVPVTVATGTNTIPEFVIPHQKGTVAGKVIDTQANVGLSGATVTVLQTTPAIVGTTGSDGSFSLSGVAAGKASIKITKTGYVSKTKTGITVAGDVVNSAGTITVARTTVTISGTVTDATTKAKIAGATITVNEQPGISAVTSTTGAYTLGKVYWGNVTLVFAKAGYLSSSAPLTIVAGTSQKQNMALTSAPSGGTLTGSVIDSGTGLGLIGATVKLSSNPNLSTTTDATGAFSLASISAGPQSVLASYAGYKTSSSATVTVVGGAMTPVGTVGLAALPATVTGQVIDSTGNPLSGVSVTAIISGQSAVTNALGSYTISGLTPGYEILLFKKSGLASSILDETSVFLNPGATLTEPPVGLSPAIAGQGVIQGTVRDSAGHPVSGATVTAVGLVSATTASDGTYAMSAPTDVYALTVDAPGFVRANSGAEWAPPTWGDNWQVKQDFTLFTASEKGSVVVSTFDPVTLQPVPGDVTVRTAHATYRILTPATVPNVPAGSLFRDFARAGSLAPGGALSLNLTGPSVVPASSWVVSGAVTDMGTSALLADTPVTITQMSTAALVGTATTDQRGRFSYVGSAAGDYCVQAQGAAYSYCFSVQTADLGVLLFPADFSVLAPEDSAITDPPNGASLSATPTTVAYHANLVPGDYIVGAYLSINGGTLNSAAVTYSVDGQTIQFAVDASLTSNSFGLTVDAQTAFGAFLEASASYQTALGTLSGRVIDGTTGSPLAGASVNITDSQEGSIRNSPIHTAAWWQVSTDDAGAFSVAVPSGTYYVSAYFDNYTSGTATGQVPIGGSVSVGDVKLYAFGSVAGRVVSAYDGTPVANANVSATGNSQTSTDDTGAFTLPVSPGPFQLTINVYGAGNWLEATFSGSIAPGQALVLSQPIPLTPLGYLKGTVTDIVTHALLPNVTITDVGTGISTLSNYYNGYEMGLPAGSRTVSYSLEGYATVTRTYNILPNAELTAADVLMDHPGSIRGSVVNAATQNGIEGATVKADTGESITTDWTGLFVLPTTPGTHSISVSAPATFPATRSNIVVTSSGSTDVGQIPLTHFGSVAGRVYDGMTGSYIDGVQVTDSVDPTLTATASAGWFSLDVPAGSHFVVLSSPGYITKTIGPFAVLANSASYPYGSWTGADVPMFPSPGTDAQGPIVQDSTWGLAGSPYYVTGPITDSRWESPFVVSACATLTIAPGVTVKFLERGQNSTIAVKGAVQALGTAAQPIVIQPTYPVGQRSLNIEFNGDCPKQSAMSWVDATDVWFYTASSSAVDLQHFDFHGNDLPFGSRLVLSYSSTRASLRNSTIPVASSIEGNVDARLNFWGTADGPSGSGPGTGARAGTNVYDPWLVTAPSRLNYLTAFKIANQTFNPSIGMLAHLDFTTLKAGTWAVTILDSAGATVRSFSGSGTVAGITWDGKDASGQSRPVGTYPFRIESVATTGEAMAPVAGRFTISSDPFGVTYVDASPWYFSPAGNSTAKTVRVSGDSVVPYPDSTWAITIKDGSGATIRSVVLSPVPAGGWDWDGRDASGNLVPDGPYTFSLTVTNDGVPPVTFPSFRTIVADSTAPVAAITSPAASALFSNLLQQGNMVVPVVASAHDANIWYSALDYGAGVTPTQWTYLGDVGGAFTNSQLATFWTYPLANGIYTIRLLTWDQAGNTAESLVPILVGNFTAKQSAEEMNQAGGSIVLTSSVPFPMAETLVIKNEAGQVVRTLLSGVQRGSSAGSIDYEDVWDGKDDAGRPVPDGGYFHVETLDDHVHAPFTWDLSTSYVNDGLGGGEGWPSQTLWDPFANKPLAITYTNDKAVRQWVIASPNLHGMGLCSPPAFCMVEAKYEESGPHTIQWAGVDQNDVFRDDFLAVVWVRDRSYFPRNAMVLYGARPKVTNVKVNPLQFAPGVGTQTVTFDLSTFQNAQTPVTVKFFNQESRSVLKTITLPSVSPGQGVQVTWDGASDNGGLKCAPGVYTVIVTATDALGQSGSGRILTTLSY